jgi:release factor glutamine methyltransferase
VTVVKAESAESSRDYRSVLGMCKELTGSETEARWLLARVAGMRTAQLALRAEEPCPAATEAAALELATRRAAGEPIQQVLGKWDFRSLELDIDRRVLIPRPETEQVVQVALEEISSPGRRGNQIAVDLGTGSGAIALSIASEGPRSLKVWAVDISADSLEVARANLANLADEDPAAAAKVQIRLGNWFEALPEELRGQVDLIVSNPPYIGDSEYEDLDRSVRDFEPRRSLVSGPDGLDDIRHIVGEAPKWLKPGGSLVVELAPHQAGEVVRLATESGFADPEIRLDLAGLQRALLARTRRRSDA